MNQDLRRGWRTVVWSLTRITLLTLLALLIDWLARGSPRSDLSYIAYGILLVIVLGELFYGSENVAARFSIKGPGQTEATFDSTQRLDSRVTPDDPDQEQG